MSFSFEAKNELCRLPVQKLCCARAEAYGVLLYCNTFSSTEVRIITENPNLAARLPRLFHRAFNLRFDRQPEPDQPGKQIFQITERKKLDHIINLLGYDPRQNLVLHINFGLLEDACCRASFLRGVFFAGGQHHRSPQALPPGVGHLPSPGQPGAGGAAAGGPLPAQERQPQRQLYHLLQAK